MSVSRETAAWAMRILTGVEPCSDAVLETLREGHETLEDLRSALLIRPEVRSLIRPMLGAGSRSYSTPGFLMRPPVAPRIPWRFEPPSIAHPVSQLCTASQMREPGYTILAPLFGVKPGELHRKFWEYGFILNALRAKGMLASGRRGLGFGAGQEPLPAILAAAGVDVLATDLPRDASQTAHWAASAQWADDVEKLWRPDVVEREAFLARVSFRHVDMNDPCPTLCNFDFNWSSSCMDHLGSIRKGLDFLHSNLATLRPGGVAVHTTEFNVASNESTLDTPTLSVFRRRDFEKVAAELIESGHSVEPLNTWPGSDPEDEHIDVAPFGLPHLKLEIGGHCTTSFGLIVTKRDR